MIIEGLAISVCACTSIPIYTHTIIKGTKVKNPRHNKCSAVIEKNCLVAKYVVPYNSGPRTIIINNCC